jgi:hypothetical protein
MSRWIALSPSQHAEKGCLPRDGYTFAAGQPVAHILLAELSRLLPHYALGFIQQDEVFIPVALLSLDGQTNLYVAPNGKWLGSYVPASLRGYPFTLANTEVGQKALCINHAHLSDDAGDPLFDEAGKRSATVQKTLDFLSQCEQSRVQTQHAAEVLTNAGVIEPWPLQVSREEGQEPLTVNGLFRVSEHALNALNEETYAALQGPPMALAHAQLFAMSQLNQLTDRARLHDRHNADQTAENVNDLFSEGDEDELEFDFGG